MSILAFASVILIGSGIILARSAGRKAAQKRLRELDEQFGPAKQRPGPAGIATKVGRLAKSLSLGAPSSTSLKEELAKAGFHNPAASAVYMGFKHALLAVGLAIGVGLFFADGLSLRVKVAVALILAAGMYFLPNIYTEMRRRKRTAEVRRHLPDMVDLLEICVASGMGLDMAWNSVADEIRRVSQILADEMALTNLEMHLGSPRTLAMRHMAERTRVVELSSLVALMIQSDRFGTSVSDTLKTFAESMRDERSQKTQEKAEKMAVKLLFPMVLFIFPAVLIVMVGPAAIRLYEAMN